jgi:hypothetical protein
MEFNLPWEPADVEPHPATARRKATTPTSARIVKVRLVNGIARSLLLEFIKSGPSF